MPRSTDSAPRPGVLLVSPPGPSRRSATATLRRAGFRVRVASEPYEGTALFVEAPADLVVLSLASFRRRDVAFVHTVRRRAPLCRVLLLVPAGRRRSALRALKAGADAWLPEPFYPEELEVLVRRLWRPAEAASGGIETVRELAAEVAHAVNNPLQILTLLGEKLDRKTKTAQALVTDVGRIRDVMRILEGFGRVGPPMYAEVRLGAILREVVTAATESGEVRLASPSPADGPPFPVDAEQVRYALAILVEFLVARSSEHPLPIKAAIHRVRRRQPTIEVVLKGRRVELSPKEFRTFQGRVIWNHEDTRQAHPGLAGPAAVAKQHGGRLVRRPGAGGVVLGFQVPVG